ncbi:26S proteasome complex subunit SEM1-like [Artibeus jamaicensis]|uniref:26S proteasome complex subunit SEM1-like n=1 Tax=Artibeus jamaicensis TaxID=9417 RepID=UPI00235A7B87|nr:26S proteasome complex subunit SEM1-like [Artibeus jamaicensis]
MSGKKQLVDVSLLEEDNEFEEFPAEDWTGLDKDAHVWEDNWNDDSIEDDFSNQLQAELERHGYKMETSEYPEEVLKQPKLELFTKF